MAIRAIVPTIVLAVRELNFEERSSWRDELHVQPDVELSVAGGRVTDQYEGTEGKAACCGK
jgi:hypothetical protein